MAGRKVINHWTAGGSKPNGTDFEHYHIIIDGYGNVYKGDHSIEDNDNTADGDYAAHTGGGNTKAYGVSLCGMSGFDLKNKKTNYPITPLQIEKLFEINAKLLFSEKYTKAVKEILMTHYEFGQSHPKTSSFGKIDITYLHAYPNLKPEEVGDFIRNKTQWYLDKLIKGEIKPEITFAKR